jgi:L-lactate dehydrogenase complex protein LldG
MTDRQSGNRDAVLARLRAGAATPPPPNHAHPAPTASHDAPSIGFRLLDAAPPVELFARTAADAGAVVSRSPDVAAVVARHGVRTAVATGEPAVEPVVAALRAAGVEVAAAGGREAATTADLGVTSCRAAIAATGSVVLDSDVVGARWASLLPRVHLCVVPEVLVVPAPADVLRSFSAAAPPPRGLWFVTGPSRTGDIEQILTRGVHGPVAVEILLLPGG